MQSFEVEKEKLVEDFFKENLRREGIKKNDQQYFENYAHASISLTKNKIAECQSKFEEDKIDIYAENVIANEELSEKLSRRRQMAYLSAKKMSDFFKYDLDIDEKFENYDKVLKKHEIEEKTIANQKIGIDESKVKIRNLNDKIRDMEYFSLLKLVELKSERNYLQKLFQQFDKGLQSDAADDQKKIEFLVSCGAKVKKKFDEKYEKLLKIIGLMNVVEKHKKITDFPIDNNERSDKISQYDFLVDKIVAVKAQNIVLKNERKFLIENIHKMKSEMKTKEHDMKVQQNIAILQLNHTHNFSATVQHSNLIPQIRECMKK